METMKLLDTVEAAQFSTWGGPKLPGDVAEAILRAWIARADAGNDTSDGEPIDAARYLLNRLDDARRRQDAELQRSREESERQQKGDALVDAELPFTKKLNEAIFDSLKPVTRREGRYDPTPLGKPEPFAEPGGDGVLVSLDRGGSLCVASCGNRARYVAPRRAQWAVSNVADDQGRRVFEGAYEQAGYCGLHARDALLSRTIRKLVDAGKLGPDYRYGRRKRGYGSGIGATVEVREGYIAAWRAIDGIAEAAAEEQATR